MDDVASEQSEQSSLHREMDLCRREKELAEREVALLRQEMELMRAGLQDREPPVNAEHRQANREKTSLSELKELVSVFDGAEGEYANWEKQIKFVKNAYALSDEKTKILISARLKGKALEWFHSRPENLESTLDDFCESMKGMFDHKPRKLVLRKRFEERDWKYSETFSEYVHEKVIMGNRVPVEDDEIVDYIIEGIPDQALRNQAKLQTFESVDVLRKAFEKVALRPRGTTWTKFAKGEPTFSTRYAAQGFKEAKTAEIKERETTGRGAVRCYRCQDIGHVSRECTKREISRSCFRCGEEGHFSRDCPKNTLVPGAQVGLVGETPREDDGFQREIKYELIYDEELFSFKLDTLLDSGSPISFIKEKFILKDAIEKTENYDSRFHGINNSKLKVLGKVQLQVSMNEMPKEKLEFFIVENNTMGSAVVLGRDALRKLGLNFDGRAINYVDESVEILNIDISGEKSDMADELQINSEIPCKIQDKLRDIFRKEYVLPERPESPEVEAEIKFVVKENQPFHFLPRRLAFAEKNEVRKKLDELLEKNVIRPSESEYASPIVLTKKKNGEMRMCVDYRKLNALMARDNYPLPVIEDQLDVLEGKVYFTSLDLKDGFYHINVAAESIKFTAFTTPFGLFEFLKCPFGVKPAPANFTRYVNKVLDKFIRSGEVVVFIDDFVIATVTLERHLEVLQEIFEVCVKNKLQLRIDKCKFLFKEIEYLGYKISKEGIRPTNRGIEAVLNFPIATNVKEIRSFIGLCSFFRRFIENFAIIAKPLYDLLRKDAKFRFGEKELEAFETLRIKLTEAPILSLYNHKHETELHCDASSIGFGAVLMQRKSDSRFHPVFYFSKRTTEVESKYHSFELETLAIVYALRRFRIYLYGIEFKIVTDCNSLTQALKKKDINPRIQRWALEFQEYDYTLEHREGSKMSHVDGLSRSNGILVIEDNSFEFSLALCQGRDAKIKALFKELEQKEHKIFELRNGLIYKKRGENLLFYVPRDMEPNILYKYHDEMGHIGIDKVCEIVQRHYWFPNLKKKVTTHVRNCLKCIAFSPTSGKVERKLHGESKEGTPFEVMHIDHTGPIDNRVVAKKYIFVTIDAFTKFVKLYATKTTNSREVIECLKHYFTHYSKPKKIVSDRGSAFTSAEFLEFVTEYGVQHVKIATASPQANGQVERVNRVLKAMLSKLTDNDLGKKWYKVLNDAEYSINNTISRATAETPSRLLFGVDQRGEVTDEVREFLKENINTQKRDFTEMREKARGQIVKSQEYNKTQYDRKHKDMHNYKVDDWVMIRNFESTAGVPHKLIPRFRGPYQIIKTLRNDRYVVADIEGFQITQKPYQGVWEPANMRLWRVPAVNSDQTSSEGDSN